MYTYMFVYMYMCIHMYTIVLNHVTHMQQQVWTAAREEGEVAEC